MMKNIGVVGYCGGKFNKAVGKALLAIAFDIVEEEHKAPKYNLVSGWTNMGIPALAYELADKRGWKTTGIACKKAYENELYPVDESKVVGNEWGDESETFIDFINVLIRIGGGDQSKEEVAMAQEKGIPIYEYDLPRTE